MHTIIQRKFVIYNADYGLCIAHVPTDSFHREARKPIESIVGAGYLELDRVNKECIFYGDSIDFAKFTKENLCEALLQNGWTLGRTFSECKFYYSASNDLEMAKANKELLEIKIED